jgi:hypothetical protein
LYFGLTRIFPLAKLRMIRSDHIISKIAWEGGNKDQIPGGENKNTLFL